MKTQLGFLLTLIVISAHAAAQGKPAPDECFDASGPTELGRPAAQLSFTDAARLSGVEDGSLFADVGFEKYTRCVYSVGGSGSLSVEIVTLRDRSAAFSILTLLRDSALTDGPPGDQYVLAGEDLRFSQGRQWIRIRGRGTSQDLVRQAALSISRRIGSERQKPPSLISRLPKTGYDASSLRYFVGAQSFRKYSRSRPEGYARFTSDMELAQARYNLENQEGVLSLSIFPTAEVAEEYFSRLPELSTAHGAPTRTYARRTGPLIGILEGSFDPRVADRILGSLNYSYSIRWIYEKPKPKTVWGVPLVILGTVLNSLLFVAVLCVLSALAGLSYALFRYWLRAVAPQNPLDRPERTEITHLKLS